MAARGANVDGKSVVKRSPAAEFPVVTSQSELEIEAAKAVRLSPIADRDILTDNAGGITKGSRISYKKSNTSC
ncbi:hypothetical protein ETB97_002652 [Aspergillus alliaceus]|uniref:Uncharacterized protein n=1 Tax=Petromyces alliaceus TaxID=209559 RepID=A0A8H6ECD0_PETAA|nr:hypothetical protein ETB97_002652 [Aspergillus burnettii]